MARNLSSTALDSVATRFPRRQYHLILIDLTVTSFSQTLAFSECPHLRSRQVQAKFKATNSTAIGIEYLRFTALVMELISWIPCFHLSACTLLLAQAPLSDFVTPSKFKVLLGYLKIGALYQRGRQQLGSKYRTSAQTFVCETSQSSAPTSWLVTTTSIPACLDH